MAVAARDAALVHRMMFVQGELGAHRGVALVAQAGGFGLEQRIPCGFMGRVTVIASQSSQAVVTPVETAQQLAAAVASETGITPIAHGRLPVEALDLLRVALLDVSGARPMTSLARAFGVGTPVNRRAHGGHRILVAELTRLAADALGLVLLIGCGSQTFSAQTGNKNQQETGYFEA
jgi:hypothetical protein